MSGPRTPRELADRMQKSRRRTVDDGFVRETFSQPRGQARAKAKDWFKNYPPEAYMSEVEGFTELPGDKIEFTMKRLKSAD